MGSPINSNCEERVFDLFKKFQNGLARTKSGLVEGVQRIVNQARGIDEEVLEELEELLILSDLGVATTETVIENLRRRSKESGRLLQAIIYDYFFCFIFLFFFFYFIVMHQYLMHLGQGFLLMYLLRRPDQVFVIFFLLVYPLTQKIFHHLLLCQKILYYF